MEPPTRTYHLDLNRTLSEFFTKGFPAVDALLVISFTVKIVPHNKNKLSGWTAIVYLTSFLLSLCLHVVGMSSSRCIRGQQVQWRGGMMAYLSTVLHMLSAATPTAVLGLRCPLSGRAAAISPGCRLRCRLIMAGASHKTDETSIWVQLGAFRARAEGRV